MNCQVSLPAIVPSRSMLFLPPDSGALEVEEIEQQLPLDIIPQEIRATLGEFVPGFEPDAVEQSVRPRIGALPTTFYEFEGTRKGESVEVAIRADSGRVIINRPNAQQAR